MTKKDDKGEEVMMTREEVIKFLKECNIDVDDLEDRYYGFGSGTVAKLSDFIPIAWDTPY
jgi:predicted sugar kinase